MKKMYTDKKCVSSRKNLFFIYLLLISFIVSPILNINAQTPWYYNGTGALNNTASWGTSTNGTGGTLPDFTSGGRVFIIQNTTNASLSGVWVIGNANFGNAGGDSLVIGNPAVASAPITLTLLSGSALNMGKSKTISVAVPSTANHKIIYQNSTPLSLGTINDPNLEVVFDGCTLTTSSASTFGKISLINNANVNMGSASLVLKQLVVDSGCVLSGPIGASSNYIAVESGGSVVINGTFRAGRNGGLFNTKVTLPVVAATTNASILFQDTASIPNLTLGNSSTIDYYRGTTGQTGTQTINAFNYANIILSNSAVASNKVFGTGTFNITGTMTVNVLGTITAPTTQTINFQPKSKLSILSPTAFPTPTGTGRLTLQSNATGNASITALATGASINGRIRVQQYIANGSRKFRFLSHPFSVAQPLSELTDDIDVTGNTAGTSLNVGQTVGYGFTKTSTNNPSAYYFNTTSADGNLTNDAGWKAFLDDSTSNWNPGQGIRILVRGPKGQTNTTNGVDATPNNVTIDLTGNPNYGPDTIKLVTGGTGTTAGFNLVGNPYPSPVDIGAVLNATTNIGTSIYLRNPRTGSYTTINPIPANYVIPAYTAFFVKANAATNVIFNENNKSECISCATLFKTQSPQNHIQLIAVKEGEEYDNIHFNFGNSYSNNYEEKTDAVKLLNSGLSIYSLTQDKQMLAADYRSINDKTTIPLGIKLPIANGMETYTLKASEFNISNGYKVILHDKLYNKYILLTKDMAYDLVIDPSNKNSIGENRLEIIIKK